MVVKEAADSAISYALAGVSFLVAHFVDTAHFLTILIGLVILGMRAAYDFVRLKRLINGETKGD